MENEAVVRKIFTDHFDRWGEASADQREDSGDH